MADDIADNHDLIRGEILSEDHDILSDVLFCPIGNDGCGTDDLAVAVGPKGLSEIAGSIGNGGDIDCIVRGTVGI